MLLKRLDHGKTEKKKNKTIMYNHHVALYVLQWLDLQVEVTSYLIIKSA